ncbi:MAG: methyltransferase domain-containing protein [Planctomycetes bacterium]|nr:methyltransferase domain-containing protein [Planctomycetota bacterium]
MCCRNHTANRSHTTHHLLLALALAIILSLVLRAHGVSLWYAPAAVVAAHAAAFAALAAFVAWITRGHRHAPGSTETAQPGILIHRPHFYDLMARFLLLGREKSFRHRTLDLANLRPGETVLDIGCGTGTLLLAASERVGPSGTLHGLEPSAEMAAHARRKAAAAGTALHVSEGSADRLPYPDASFDAAFCTMVLHHVPAENHAAALREMRRVLKPGGRLVIVEMRRPRSIRAALSLFNLLHGFASHAYPADPAMLEPAVRDLGFEQVALPALGFSLGALTALKGTA